jgi:hypothetical protein
MSVLKPVTWLLYRMGKGEAKEKRNREEKEIKVHE